MKSLIVKLVVVALPLVGGVPAAEANVPSPTPTVNGPAPGQVEAGWWLQQQAQRQRPAFPAIVVPTTTPRSPSGAQPAPLVPSVPRPRPLTPSAERALADLTRRVQRNGMRSVAPVTPVCPTGQARR